MPRTLRRASHLLSRALTFVLLVGTAVRAGAQMQPLYESRDALHAPGKDVTVHLMTMGNGSDVYEMFGHSSFWIHDNVTQRDTVINWGVFDRDQPNFIPHFLKGLMLYSVGGNRLQDVLYSYRYWNRSVTTQELNLTATQRDTLLAMVRANFLPENVHYRYDYFVDNCATKPRDILDHVLGGQLRIGADSLSGTSYRWHATRLMQGNKPLVLGVNIGLGRPSDREITKWQEMFLPRKLHDWVATRQVRDSTGALRPLALNDRVLFQANRPPEAEAPPSFAWLWGVGVGIGVLFIVVGFAARESRAARIVAATLFSVWATICGLLGILLTLLWTVTDHRFAHQNENLLLFHPLWLILAVALPMTIVRRRDVGGTTRWLSVFLAASALALLAHVGVSQQMNLSVIGLALPPVAALWIVVRRLA